MFAVAAVALVLSGDFGGGRRVAALDEAGAVLSWGRGIRGNGAISVCPGEKRLVQAGRNAVVIRRLPDLRPVLTLPGRGRVARLRCLSSSGDDVVVSSAQRPGLVRLRRGRPARVLIGDPQPYAHLGRRMAIAAVGRSDWARMQSVDYATGARRLFAHPGGRFPRHAAFSPDETRVAFVPVDIIDPWLAVLDARTAKGRGVPLRTRRAAPVHWLDGSRLFAEATQRIYDAATLAVVATAPARIDIAVAVARGGEVYSLDRAGVLRRGTTVLGTLNVRRPRALAAVETVSADAA